MSCRASARPKSRLQWQCDRAPVIEIFLAAIMAAAAFLAPGQADAAGKRASMAIDANTGNVLYAQGAEESRYPASLTKLMTLYLVFEQLEAGRLSGSTRIKISENAARTPPSRLGLRAGEDIALSDAVKALITKSANDIAVAVAEHIAGSEERFAQQMTRKARELGMTATTFRNPHGLPDAGQVTTARDMLTLAMRLNDDFPKYYRLFSLRTFHYAGRAYRNHNTMLAYYRGMDGLKTGYTTSSGFNLVASVRRDGKHVVAVVFGGSSSAARNVQMRAILDRALARASTHRTRKHSEPKLVAEHKPVHAPARRYAHPAEPRLLEPVRRVAEPPPRRAMPVAREETMPTTGAPRLHITRVRSIRVEPVGVTPPVPPPVATDKEPAARDPLPPARAPSRLAAFAQPSAMDSPALGNAPSTFAEQAQRIAEGQAPVAPAGRSITARASMGPPPSGLGRPELPHERTDEGTTAIQVGAYTSASDARQRLAAVQSANAHLLANARPATETVSTKGKTLYRARFVGFDTHTASRVCTELRRAAVDCHVTR